MARMSVEKRANPRELNAKTGFGYAIDFTDPARVGKPAKKGDSKVRTMVMLILSPKVGVSGAIDSDGVKEPAHQHFLAMFQSMEVLPAAPPKR